MPRTKIDSDTVSVRIEEVIPKGQEFLCQDIASMIRESGKQWHVTTGSMKSILTCMKRQGKVRFIPSKVKGRAGTWILIDETATA